ncbi:MAG: glutathione S-transferase family protein [Proteobacteria bacterium]|jgi:glutathione S-transferase|nr:glutathione S-transferase family protein [Pseudomonadota bacterium]MDA0928310.1 glutathione S-transferase family protein [Pseudomonadota bacterium]
MRLKLYGMPLSNYYNMVKTILIEKGMDFEEVLVKPNQEAGYLTQSPMGKVPCLETEKGFLTETTVIINYLDALGQGPGFYPADPFERAKVEELIHYMELYLELPARRLYGEVFFGREPNETLREEVRGQLEKGFAALARIAKYEPYIAGPEITYADFFFRFSVNLASIVARKALNWDVYNEIAEIKPLMSLMDERESVQRAMADQQAGN